jgi:glycosyltransferase involved in cell wall biosynthesis
MYVLSSQTEGFSISCVEAMATGLPVVATRCGGPEEILSAGGGILVPVGSPESLAEAVQRVAFTPGLGATLAADGLRRAREVFSIQRMLDSYERLLIEVTPCATSSSN